jgi:hypothetical protein
MYVQRKIEARSHNHCYRGKVVLHILSVCVCVCVALLIQHAMRMRRIVICGLSGCTLCFFNPISQTAQFSGKKSS